jgi:hypothetical protein
MALISLAGCTSSKEAIRPKVYRGGQDYGKAWHANDARSQ